MNDRGLAALAAALRDTSIIPEEHRGSPTAWAHTAGRILAALPPDWCGHEVPGSPEWEAGYNRGKEDSNIATIATITALRATLTEIRDTARSTYSQRCQWCDPLSLAQLILRPHRPDCPAAIAAVALGTP